MFIFYSLPHFSSKLPDRNCQPIMYFPLLLLHTVCYTVMQYYLIGTSLGHTQLYDKAKSPPYPLIECKLLFHPPPPPHTLQHSLRTDHPTHPRLSTGILKQPCHSKGPLKVTFRSSLSQHVCACQWGAEPWCDSCLHSANECGGVQGFNYLT